MKFAKKTICLAVAALMITVLLGGIKVDAKTKAKDANVKSISFKTSTGGDFVAGVCKMKITFKLDADSNATINIINSDDDVVYTRTIKKCKKNKACTIAWDGKNTKGKKYVDEGFYSVEIKTGKKSTRSDELDVINGSFMLIRKSGFAGGDGSKKKPYQVKNAAQLNKVVEHNGKNFKQVANINLDYASFSSIFSNENRFTGTYDGGNHSISNGIISDGIFNTIDEKGEISNLIVSGCNISGHVAGVICRENYGTLKNCQVSSCTIAQGGSANEKASLGGVCAINHGKINKCTVSDLSIMDSTKYTWIGGLCADNTGSIIQCSVSDSNLVTNKNESWGTMNMAGGLCGHNNGTIVNSSVSEVETTAYAAGILVGKNEGVVSGCTPKSQDLQLIGTGNAAV